MPDKERGDDYYTWEAFEKRIQARMKPKPVLPAPTQVGAIESLREAFRKRQGIITKLPKV